MINSILVTRNDAGALVFESYHDGVVHSTGVFKDERDWLPVLRQMIETTLPEGGAAWTPPSA